MNWTTEYPTKPGYYWIRNYAWRDDPELIKDRPDIVSVAGGFYFTANDQSFSRDDLLSAEWYGPIEPPE